MPAPSLNFADPLVLAAAILLLVLSAAVGAAAGHIVRQARRAVDVQREDLASRDLAAAALRRSLKELEDLKYALDQSAIVATTNVRGDITYVNDTFCTISKYSREELLGGNHRMLNSGLHPLEFFRDMYGAIGQGRVWRGEIRNRAKDGSHYWVYTTIVPVLDERGHPVQYVAVRYDITGRKRSEAALRDQNALAQLGKMAAVVAHEVRNPLAGIRGALQVIGRRLAASSEEHAVVQEVVARVDTLNGIVEDLLLFARPIRPVLAPVPVAMVVDETVALFRQDPLAASVTVQIEPSVAIVMADAQQLKLVLLNLIMNGAQAMQGRGALTISTHAAGAFHDIRITDHGPGIPEDVRERLFEPFFTTRHRGTGLGLVTARRLMEAHGGTVLLECPADGGTTATIRVPPGEYTTGTEADRST